VGHALATVYTVKRQEVAKVLFRAITLFKYQITIIIITINNSEV